MSRQRLRTGVLEASTHNCPMCAGAGVIRSVPSAALAAIRALEEQAVRGRHSELMLRAADDVAVYLLNRKRAQVVEIEERYGVRIDVVPDPELVAAHFEVDAAGSAPDWPDAPRLTRPPLILEEPDEDEAFEEAEIDDDEDELAASATPRGRDRERTQNGDGRSRRKRRRGGRGRKSEEGSSSISDAIADDVYAAADDDTDDDGAAPADLSDAFDGPDERDNRRKRRRGGRRRRGARDRARADAELAIALDSEADDSVAFVEPLTPASAGEAIASADQAAERAVTAEAGGEDTPKPKRRRRKADEDAGASAVAAQPPAPAELPSVETAGERPKRASRKKKDAVSAADPAAEQSASVAAAETKSKRTRKAKAGGGGGETENSEPSNPADSPASAIAGSAETAEGGSPQRRGWWQRTIEALKQ